MKRQERQHLRENELVHGINVVRDYVAPRGRQVGMVVGALIAVAVIVLAVIAIRQRGNTKAEAALAEALVAYNARVVPPSDPEAADLPESAQLGSTGTFATEAAKMRVAIPKLKAVADAYPDKEGGIVARYHMAGALASVGRNDEAIKEFAEVVRLAPKDSVYSRMARLGQADTQARAGQLDAAIASWKQLADENNADLPADAILLELGRAYVAKGNTAEAKKVLTELLDKHPTSPYSTDAKTALDNLKG
jgi:tetratricopeptide (TPR) repeat protein